MKKQCNFYKRNFSLLFTGILCLTTLFSYGQTDKENDQKREAAKEDIKKELLTYGNRQSKAINKFLAQGFKQVIETKDGEYSELIGENSFGNPMYFTTHNNKIVAALRANILNSGFDGLNLEGEGIKIGLWENGRPRQSHEMFRLNTTSPVISRIEYVIGQNTTLQRHATHVAGTIIGNQYLPSASSPANDLVRGVAYKGTIKAWDWLNVPAEMMTACTTDNIKLANTSFGLNPIYMHASEFGRYNEIAKQWDAVMCANPEFQIVKSVGNARDDKKTNGFPEYPQVNILGGYDLLEGAGVAKNTLVVGAVNLQKAIQVNVVQKSTAQTNVAQVNGNQVNVSQLNVGYNSSLIGTPYSSWEATDDGRIKPDLVTQGSNIYSSIETQNNNYAYYSGTSQAAAGVTGGIALLHNYWNSKFRSTMWSSTVRGLLIHNVDEIDDRGPDYRYGWGLVNLQKAANTIKEKGKSVIIREEVLNNGEIIKLNIATTGKEDLKVTIAWTDPAGNVAIVDPRNPNLYTNEVTAKLINDLDIKLIRKNTNGDDDVSLIDPVLSPTTNNVLLPWILKEQIQGNTTETLGQRAQRGDNKRDNVEKIEVYKNLIPPTGGMFQLQISHKGTLNNACQIGQPFSLIVSGVSFCSDNLVFLQNQDNELSDNTTTKVLSNTIKASNIIKAIPAFAVNNPDFVDYNAADFIELLPQSQNGGAGNEGFTAEYGSDFYAHIDCSSDTNQRAAFSKKEVQDIVTDNKVEESIITAKGEMIVFPNPLINDVLHIQFSLIESSTLDIAIYDISGKLVFKEEGQNLYEPGVSKKTIDLQQLPTGFYILDTKTKEGNGQIKFIKR